MVDAACEAASPARWWDRPLGFRCDRNPNPVGTAPTHVVDLENLAGVVVGIGRTVAEFAAPAERAEDLVETG